MVNITFETLTDLLLQHLHCQNAEVWAEALSEILFEVYP